MSLSDSPSTQSAAKIRKRRGVVALLDAASAGAAAAAAAAAAAKKRGGRPDVRPDRVELLVGTSRCLGSG